MSDNGAVQITERMIFSAGKLLGLNSRIKSCATRVVYSSTADSKCKDEGNRIIRLCDEMHETLMQSVKPNLNESEETPQDRAALSK